MTEEKSTITSHLKHVEDILHHIRRKHLSKLRVEYLETCYICNRNFDIRDMVDFDFLFKGEYYDICPNCNKKLEELGFLEKE